MSFLFLIQHVIRVDKQNNYWYGYVAHGSAKHQEENVAFICNNPRPLKLSGPR